MATLARRLGPFDATMIVMGGIIGSGIFINPHVVALQVHSATLIVYAWIAGGLIALLGAFALPSAGPFRFDSMPMTTIAPIFDRATAFT